MRWDPEKRLDSDSERGGDRISYFLETDRRLPGGSQVGFGFSCSWDGRNVP